MMAHWCPTCGQACYCDGDDTWMEDEHGQPLEDCVHDCDPDHEREED